MYQKNHAYLNNPYNGFVGPHIILNVFKKWLTLNFKEEGLKINFHVTHAVSTKSEDSGNML